MTEDRLFNWSCPDAVAIGGELSVDDELWICSCSLGQVQSLIENPKLWMDCLSKNAGKKITLAEHFVIKMSLIPRVACKGPAVQPAGGGSQFIVQGINNTGVITVRPSVVSMPFLSRWDEYWKEWASNLTAFPIGRANDHGQGYAHLELSSKDHTKQERADRIAAFLMLGADPRKKFSIDGEPEDLYMNWILKKESTELFGLSETGTTSMVAGKREFSLLTEGQLSQVNFLFQGRKSDFPDTLEPEEIPVVDETIPACDNKAGTILSDGFIRLDDVTVKSYKE